jgi:hypothetical protein
LVLGGIISLQFDPGAFGEIVTTSFVFRFFCGLTSASKNDE